MANSLQSSLNDFSSSVPPFALLFDSKSHAILPYKYPLLPPFSALFFFLQQSQYQTHYSYYPILNQHLIASSSSSLKIFSASSSLQTSFYFGKPGSFGASFSSLKASVLRVSKSPQLLQASNHPFLLRASNPPRQVQVSNALLIFLPLLLLLLLQVSKALLHQGSGIQ